MACFVQSIDLTEIVVPSIFRSPGAIETVSSAAFTASTHTMFLDSSGSMPDGTFSSGFQTTVE